MTEPTAQKRGLSTAGGIKLILLLQLGIAMFLFGSDIARVLPRLALSAPDAPRLTQPVLPGDQRRLYDRKHAPSGPSAPDTGDMPSRLVFEMDGDVLRLTGAIAENDAVRFDDWLVTREIPAFVELHSTGGSVTDALAIGKRLRAAEATTRVTEGLVCLSACPYILASGVARQVHKDAYVGVHQHSYGESTVLPAFLAIEDIQRGQGEVMEYLDAMGVDLRLMQHALATPPQEIYILIPEELERYALATEILE
jgi:hypothetical protein